MQQILKIHRVNPEENASPTYRQTDRQMSRTTFMGLLPQNWRFNHVSAKVENKIWK